MNKILHRGVGLAICLALALSLVLPTMVLALSGPCIFAGTASVNGEPVDAGTPITAWAENLATHEMEQVGATVTDPPPPGFYEMNVNLNDATHSPVIHFKIDTLNATETATWVWLGQVVANLTASNTTLPIVNTVTPNQGYQGETLDDVTITGTNFNGATEVDFGTGITVDFTVDSNTQITADITIASGAALGARDVSVTTPAGEGTLEDGFTVLPPELEPTVTAVDPDHGRQGETLDDVVITGTNFDGATLVSFGAGITVNDFTPDSTQITADITIALAATTGFRDVSVTTPGGTGTLEDGFTVLPETVPEPTVTAVDPAQGSQGETLDVVITGTDFYGATLVSFGDGITVNDFTVNTNTQITADITIALAAAIGFRDVSVTTPGGTGTLEDGFTVEATKPDEVWVDDDWSNQTDVDQYDPSLVWQYDAFATIQDGIDNVGSSTVHVLPGTYDGFEVEETEDLSIIGEEGAVVTDAIYITIESEEFWVMALVMNSQDIDIEGLDFDGGGIAGKAKLEGIAYAGSTGSITDVTVSDVAGSQYGIGISVSSGEIDTVDISDTTVEGCQIGVMVWDDQANLEGCTITGPLFESSIGIYAMYGAIVNIESCEILGFWYGVFVDDGGSTVEITECSTITYNAFGIYVEDGVLVANGNDIAGNGFFGIYNNNAVEVDAEDNWWGDAKGPEHEDNPFFATTTGDEVSDNVDYIPWLDAPCPGGKSVGPEADFVAEPRIGMAPLEVQFTDQSTGPDFDIVSWAWDFGDGTTSAEQDPTHTYSETGTYTVSLTVTDELGLSDTETKSNYITVRRELPTEEEEPANLKAAYLYISPEQVQPNQQVEISINIGNDGGSVGTRSIALYINGYLEDSQTVTVSPGSAKNVVFTVTRAEPGTYQVLLEGNEGQFTVLGTADGHWAGSLGTGGIIAIVVFVIALVLGLVFILRRE